MLLLPALLWLQPGDAQAQANPRDPVEVTQPTPEQRLDEAIRVYLRGDLPGARNLLIVLVQDPEMTDPQLTQEARIWLGEVQYLLGETAAAESTFRAALAHDPDLRMDTFDHPPEVVSFFNSIQAQVQVSTPDPPPVSPRSPLALALVPGGLQFYNEQPGWGGLTLGAVSLSLAGTLGMNLYLRQFDELPDQRGIQILVHQGQRDKEALAALQRTRVLQWSLASVGALSWSTSVAVGLLQSGPSSASVTLTVAPSGLALTGRF